MNFFAKDDFKAQLFFTRDQQHTVSNLIGNQHPTPGNVGVCLSGGGSRALTCGMGQLRALKKLQINGSSLLGQVKALSTVSGGSWVGVPFLYLNETSSDDDYLNLYVEDQSRLVPSSTAGHSLAETLNELPENNIGQGPAEVSFSPVALAISALLLYKFYKVPVDMLWQTLVGSHILKDYNLYDPGFWNKAPTSLYSYNQEILQQDVLANNPELQNKTAHLFVETSTQRLHRPFLICNMSMFVNLPGTTEDFLVPVQATPFFTGIVGNPEGALDANKQAVGGGGVTAFAFNSKVQDRDNLDVEITQQRSWALTDAVGVSSAFFAEKVNQIFDDMRKKPELIKQHLENNSVAVSAWVKKVLPQDNSSLLNSILDKLDNSFDKVENTLFSDTEISDILDDIDDLVPEYFYWHAKDTATDTSLKTNRFADGGNLENTGIASLLSYQDIDNLIAFVNTSTPMTAAKKGVMDEDGKEIPGTRIEVDSQVPVLFGYQPYDEKNGYQLYSASDDPKAPDFKFNQVFECSAFAEFLIKMWQASGNAEQAGSNQRPAICKQTLQVLENTWFGVKVEAAQMMPWEKSISSGITIMLQGIGTTT